MKAESKTADVKRRSPTVCGEQLKTSRERTGAMNQMNPMRQTMGLKHDRLAMKQPARTAGPHSRPA